VSTTEEFIQKYCASLHKQYFVGVDDNNWLRCKNVSVSRFGNV